HHERIPEHVLGHSQVGALAIQVVDRGDGDIEIAGREEPLLDRDPVAARHVLVDAPDLVAIGVVDLQAIRHIVDGLADRGAVPDDAAAIVATGHGAYSSRAGRRGHHVDVDEWRLAVHVLDVVLVHREVDPAGAGAIDRAEGDVAVAEEEDALLRLEPAVGEVDLLHGADLVAAAVVDRHAVGDLAAEVLHDDLFHDWRFLPFSLGGMTLTV